MQLQNQESTCFPDLPGEREFDDASGHFGCPRRRVQTPCLAGASSCSNIIFFELLDKHEGLTSYLDNTPTIKLKHAICRRQSFADGWRARKENQTGKILLLWP